ncbi:MAG: glucokinase [Candidatus Acidiferrales bacterium]|jgi:glucokinase
MILAGDIGGTKCNLGAFEADGPRLRLVFQKRYSTRDSTGFETLIENFQREAAAMAGGTAASTISAAGFGVPGTVVAGQRHSVNLPWTLDPVEMAKALKLDSKHVVLLNDLVATAWGIQNLPRDAFLALNTGVPRPNANMAVLAAGTGLGEAILFWDGQSHRVSPSEGGMTDFAPRNDREVQLLLFLKTRMPHVCCEDVLAGRGFRAIHESLDPAIRHSTFDQRAEASAHEITEMALARSCPVCVDTLNMWAEAYGAEAGNLALRVLAYGGVYVAGGIALKVLPKIKDGSFVRAFCDKAHLADVLARIPISVVLNEDAPLWGAAHQALAASLE